MLRLVFNRNFHTLRRTVVTGPVILLCCVLCIAFGMKPDQDRVRQLLTQTICLLCKSGLKFDRNVCIEGVLGFTVDDSDVFIVHIDEKMILTESKTIHSSASGEDTVDIRAVCADVISSVIAANKMCIWFLRSIIG